eukprot:2534039-Amphidinium_carterae.1
MKCLNSSGLQCCALVGSVVLAWSDVHQSSNSTQQKQQRTTMSNVECSALKTLQSVFGNSRQNARLTVQPHKRFCGFTALKLVRVVCNGSPIWRV